MKARTLVSLALGFAAAVALGQATVTLGPGSPAPAIEAKTWFKGTPVTSIDPSKTYVVEFWATWCGPCRDSIPHLTELAKKNPDVTFLGFSIWEEDKGGAIKKFVDEMGAKMEYHVAYSGDHDGMAKSWMEAAGQDGIPTAFVVKEGKIAWIGHPMELEGPLGEIKAGTFDAAKFKGEFDKRTEEARRESAFQTALSEIRATYDGGKRAEAKTALDRLAAENPARQGEIGGVRFDWLADSDRAAWEVEAKRRLASADPLERESLLEFATKRSIRPVDRPLARRALQLALAAKPKDLYTLYVAQSAYGRMGDDALALAAVDRILLLIPTSEMKDSPEFKSAMLKRRAELRARVKTTSKAKSPTKVKPMSKPMRKKR